MSALRILSVPAADVRPLRKSLLRPMQAAEELVYGGDDAAETLHAAGFVGDRMVGIASVSRQPFQDKPAYRLRGMGTVPDVRGLGYGRALLEYCVDFVVSQQVETVWCNARKSAVGFYERASFTIEGAEFELPNIGPHVIMFKRV